MLGVGTRWTDFTTASKAGFQDPSVRFVDVNVARLDAVKLGGLADRSGRAPRRSNSSGAHLGDHRAPVAWTERAARERSAWLELRDDDLRRRRRHARSRRRR